MQAKLKAPTKRMIARINKLKGGIAKKRDELRDLTSDLEQICDNCDEAVESLTGAADKLSELL